MKTKGSLTLTIRHPEGQSTVFHGEAEWHTDAVEMVHKSGPALPGFDPSQMKDLEWHAFSCSAAALAMGLDTEEVWDNEGFQGGRLR